MLPTEGSSCPSLTSGAVASETAASLFPSSISPPSPCAPSFSPLSSSSSSPALTFLFGSTSWISFSPIIILCRFSFCSFLSCRLVLSSSSSSESEMSSSASESESTFCQPSSESESEPESEDHSSQAASSSSPSPSSPSGLPARCCSSS
jgi:hypothetical protein